MRTLRRFSPRGFTLLETVIAIGVLAVLLTGFMVVFAPAADGIRKSINVQEADRLTSTLERELVTKRDTATGTGFTKAFDWIKGSSASANALVVYQYRGKTSSLRSDGTPQPEPLLDGKLPGRDYIVVPMVRRRSDTTLLQEDLKAIEGRVYLTKCTQLVFNGGELKLGSAGKIVDPKNPGTESASSDAYPEAVIAFAAEFHALPSKSYSYIQGLDISKLKTPIFTRNLAVRR
jgi:prepilin-type N-terminal cleavage/methylation domain-containing protein